MSRAAAWLALGLACCGVSVAAYVVDVPGCAAPFALVAGIALSAGWTKVQAVLP